MKKQLRYFATAICCILFSLSNHSIAQVGIGTTSPEAALDIESSDQGILIPRVQLSSATDNTTVRTPDGEAPINSTLIYNLAGSGSGSNYINKGFHYWENGRWIAFSDADWYRRFSTQVPNAITDDIYTNGRVGIGTDTPNYELEVDGSVLIRENNDFIIGSGPIATSNAMRLSHDGMNSFFDSKGRSTQFRGSAINTGSGDNILMSIDNDTGHVAIGPDTPEERLHVQQGNFRIDTDFRLQFGEFYENTDPIHFKRVNIAEDQTELQLMIGDNGVPGDVNQDFFKIGHRSTSTSNFVEKFSFGASGTAFKPGGGSWAALSDRRVKKNINPFTYGLDAIKKIKPVTYRYNANAGYGESTKEYVGVIAQEIEEVLPMTVTKHQENGFTDLRRYDPTALTYTLINAVKEINDQNEQLALKAEHLEALAEQLENTLIKLEGND